jgi:RHS repeat-associated protein
VSGTRYYSTNPHGDTEVLTDPGTGLVKSSYRYTAYGSEDTAGASKGNLGEDATPTGVVDPTREVVNPYRYSSKRVDAASGDYDMGFRSYAPGLNSFTSRDMYNGALADVAMGMDPWNANRYAFAGGNPISHVDLDGHLALDTDTGVACDAQCAADLDAFIHPPAAEDDGGLWGSVSHFVSEHKADIAGIATGIAVGVGCELAAAGAAGSAVTNALDPNADHSFGGFVKAATVGAAVNVATAGLGKVAGAGLKAVAGKVGGKVAASADDLVSAVDAQAARVVGSQSIRQRGPVLTGAMDRQTGDVFFGQNTGIPSPLHRELAAALDAFAGPGAAGKGIPGTHSEFNAINQGLFARPGASISDFLLYSVRLRGSDQGSQIMMCPNCANILKGAEDLFR